jgi:hypothetical protein
MHDETSNTRSASDTYAFGNTGQSSASWTGKSSASVNASMNYFSEGDSLVGGYTNNLVDSDGVAVGGHGSWSSMTQQITSRTYETGASGISWTDFVTYAYGTANGFTDTQRTGMAATDLGVTIVTTGMTDGGTTTTSSSSSITYSAPRSTATTGWGTTTSGVGFVETSTTVTETSEQVTAVQVTTTAGTVTGSYWETQYTEVTATLTVHTVVTAVGTTLSAQTTTYDPASQHVNTVISRTSPAEWLFIYGSLWAGVSALTAVADAFDLTTSSARADSTITHTLREVTNTATVTKTTTGFVNAASTVTRSTLSNVTSTAASWSGGFPMATHTAFRALATTTTAVSFVPVTTSGTVTYAPAGNLQTLTVTLAYSPLTTRAAIVHNATGGSVAFAEPVQVASTYTRESYQASAGITSAWTTFSTATSLTAFGLSGNNGRTVGSTSLQTANRRFGSTASSTPAGTPYQTIARAHGWQAGISAGPADSMGTQITADRTVFLGGIVAAFAAASPTCLQEQNYHASTVTSDTTISAYVGTAGSWHVTTAKRTTLTAGTATYTAQTASEAFTLSLGLAGGGDQFTCGSAGALGVSGASFTGIAAGYSRFSGESTFVSFAPGAYLATGLDSAGASTTAATTVALPGTTAAYANTAVAIEPGVALVSNSLTAAGPGAKALLVVSSFDPES